MPQLFCSMVSDDDGGLSTVAWEHDVLSSAILCFITDLLFMPHNSTWLSAHHVNEKIQDVFLFFIPTLPPCSSTKQLLKAELFRACVIAELCVVF